MKTIFQFKRGCHLRGDAQAVGEELERLRARRALLTPEVVLASARPKTSPLHEFFEWDDDAAAERYRLAQAGYLIRSVTVIYENADEEPARQVAIEGVAAAPRAPVAVRAFVAITRDDGRSGFESTATAMNDPVLRRQVLERAHSEMMAVGRKYQELRELSDVFLALDRVGHLLREHPEGHLS